jgi:hypothetical protein
VLHISTIYFVWLFCLFAVLFHVGQI